MQDIFAKIAEAKIKEALRKGELTNLPGEGKPIEFEPVNPFEAPEDRMANKIMKNLGLAPQEVELKKEMDRLQKEIAICSSGKEKKTLKKKLQEANIFYSVLMEKRRRR